MALVLLVELLRGGGGSFHSFQREQFHIVLWCSAANLLIAALLSYYVAVEGWVVRAKTVVLADIAISVLPAGLAVCAYYVLRPGFVHYFGGLLAVFLLSKCAICTILPCENANWAHGRKPLRWFLFAVSLIVFATFAPWYTLASTPQGDESHYLILTYSLVHDHDFLVQNNYKNGNYIEQFPPLMPGLNRWYSYWSQEQDVVQSIPLDPHVVTNSRGEQLIWHDVGVPVLLVPGYALGKRLGAVLTVAVVAATLPVAILEIAMLLGAGLAPSIIAGVVFTFTPPLYCYAQTVFPETFGAALVLWTVAFFLLYRDKAQNWYVLCSGLAIALLPWMCIRFWPLAGILFLVFAAYLAHRHGYIRSKAIMTLALLCLPSLISLMVFAVFDHTHFGTYLPNGGNQLTQQQNPRVFWWRSDIAILGMLFDAAWGLLPTAPLYIAAVAGTIVVLKRRNFWGAAILLAPSVTYVALLSLSSFWDGGWCPPGRYILSGAVLLAPAAALVFTPRTKRFLMFLAGWTALVDLIYTADPFTRFPSIFHYGPPAFSGLMEFLHDRIRIYELYSPLSIFPVMRGPHSHDYILAYIWVAISLAALVWLVRRTEPKPKAQSGR